MVKMYTERRTNSVVWTTCSAVLAQLSQSPDTSGLSESILSPCPAFSLLHLPNYFKALPFMLDSWEEGMCSTQLWDLLQI